MGGGLRGSAGGRGRDTVLKRSRQAGQGAQVDIKVLGEPDEQARARNAVVALEVREVRSAASSKPAERVLGQPAGEPRTLDEWSEGQGGHGCPRETFPTETSYRVPEKRNSTKMHGRVYEQLGEARRVARVTQDQVAAEVGWDSRATVSNIEAGRRDTHLHEAEKWAKLCGYEIVLVPTGEPDPEGLSDLVAAIRDPAARQVMAELARLVRKPHRYWMHLLADIQHEADRARRDEERDR